MMMASDKVVATISIPAYNGEMAAWLDELALVAACTGTRCCAPNKFGLLGAMQPDEEFKTYNDDLSYVRPTFPDPLGEGPTGAQIAAHKEAMEMTNLYLATERIFVQECFKALPEHLAMEIDNGRSLTRLTMSLTTFTQHCRNIENQNEAVEIHKIRAELAGAMDLTETKPIRFIITKHSKFNLRMAKLKHPITESDQVDNLMKAIMLADPVSHKPSMDAYLRAHVKLDTRKFSEFAKAMTDSEILNPLPVTTKSAGYHSMAAAVSHTNADSSAIDRMEHMVERILVALANGNNPNSAAAIAAAQPKSSNTVAYPRNKPKIDKSQPPTKYCYLHGTNHSHIGHQCNQKANMTPAQQAAKTSTDQPGGSTRVHPTFAH
jgi:hypothetical protein